MIINTNKEEFKNDIYDIMHMFYPNLILNEDDGVVLTHGLKLFGDEIENCFNLNGKTFSEKQILPKIKPVI